MRLGWVLRCMYVCGAVANERMKAYFHAGMRARVGVTRIGV